MASRNQTLPYANSLVSLHMALVIWQDMLVAANRHFAFGSRIIVWNWNKNEVQPYIPHSQRSLHLVDKQSWLRFGTPDLLVVIYEMQRALGCGDNKLPVANNNRNWQVADFKSQTTNFHMQMTTATRK